MNRLAMLREMVFRMLGVTPPKPHLSPKKEAKAWKWWAEDAGPRCPFRTDLDDPGAEGRPGVWVRPTRGNFLP